MKWLRGLKRWQGVSLIAGLLLVALALILAQAPGGKTTAPAPSAAPPGTPTIGLLSRQQAEQAAVRIGSQSQPEMNASSIPPSVVYARQISLLQALREMDPSTTNVPDGQDPNLAVWLVRLDGSWLDGAPRPTELPPPAPYLHMTVVLDGISGEQLFSFTGPGESQPALLPTALPGTDAGVLAQSALENFLGSLAPAHKPAAGGVNLA